MEDKSYTLDVIDNETGRRVCQIGIFESDIQEIRVGIMNGWK